MLRSPLSREITAVLVFKAAFLAALYFAFFAGPAPGPIVPILAPASGEGSAAQ